MFRLLTWLWRQLDVFETSGKGDPVSPKPAAILPPRLDEFHKTTYEELYSAAWDIVAGTPPPGISIGDHFLSQLTTRPDKGARIEFNEKGEGRVLVVDEGYGVIDIGMENLPVKVRWDPSRSNLKPTESQNREFFVRLMDGQIPVLQAGGKEPIA